MNRPRFEGKIAVVTGGASGIGAEIARQLVQEGARIVVADMNDPAGADLVAALGDDKAIYRHCDVSVAAEIDAAIQLAVDTWGGLDLLFNNAGILCDLGTTPDTTARSWERVIAVDLNSVFYGCHAAIPHLRRRGGGAIVNTASISGLGGDYGANAYNAAKGGVVNYTRTLAIDHAAENIRVNALCPGYIDTAMTSVFKSVPGLQARWVANIPMQRGGTTREMARAALFLASDDASYITGVNLVADGGITAATGQPSVLALLAESRVA